ncbi:3-hydroxy-3-methylglutaryl-coenzyme A reductase related protein [Thermoplasma acidophilum]|uniref:3-hydroxy-3-methylglutaryl-coenzyme A reductase related protein n=3 Tax=Thermoplasma acidophilum TaxID=2303 RepID=Q9HL34_THEAC|nr:hydroxymethylglutaryl-CoA reductase, degradative [Thermoplasma acidophilum]CAC11548.1 3-hydroxy-3-methylglutaryl-coenzyme A reductase related protein [Thermoplasma acidophilum]
MCSSGSPTFFYNVSISTSMKTSDVSGFYKLSVDDRIQFVKEFSDLTDDEVSILKKNGSLPIEKADKIIENVITTIEMPMGIAVNFRINDRDYLIPMAIEEPSVVAAASNAAKVARKRGGFRAFATEPIMIGEIQVLDVPAPYSAKIALLESKQKILDMANTRSKTLSSMNAGARDLEVEIFEYPYRMMIVHLIVDVRDAMGANVINSMCEYVAPEIARITGGRVNLRILSNLTKNRIAYASAVFPKEIIGEEAVDSIIEAYHMAAIDIYRAATNNKGIMNGVDAVLIATMNDWRSAEANAHSYAAMYGYGPLARYEKDANGDLVGSIEIPMAVGTIGGTTRSIEKARIAMKILGVKDAKEFSGVLAAVGLAQNFAALRALATEGIQRGHMELHSRNIAMSVGAVGDEIDKVVSRMIEEKNISMANAQKILQEIRNKN